MNIESFPLFVAIWGIFSLVLFLLLKNSEDFARKKRYFLIAALCIMAVLFPAYAKIGLSGDFVFYSSDESGLKGNYGEFSKAGIWGTHSSGPAMLLLLDSLVKISGLGLDAAVNAFGAFAAVFTVIAIIVFLKKATKSYKLSIGGAALALYSSYLIWPLIEVRPQQIGFVFFLFVGMMLFDSLKLGNRKALAFAVFFISWSAALHILSHFLLLPLVLLTIAYAAVSAVDSWRGKFFSSCAIIISWFLSLFLSFSFFDSVFDFHFLLKRILVGSFGFANTGLVFEVQRPFLEIPEFKLSYPLAALVLVALFAVIAAVLAVFLKRKTIAKAAGRFFEIARRTDTKRMFIIMAIVGLSMIAVQTVLHLEDLDEWYYSPVFFVLFESGNLLFGLLAVYGFAKSLQNANGEGFYRVFLPAIGLAGFFALNLATGFAMTKGFENFSMRTMNYLVAFLGLFAFVGISATKGKNLARIAFVLALLFPASFIIGTREPSFIKQDITYLAVSEGSQLFSAQEAVKDANYHITFLNSERNADENYFSNDLLAAAGVWKAFGK